MMAASVASLVAGTVTLAWDPSPSPDVDRYKVYYGKGTNFVFAAGNTNALSVTVTNQTTCTVSNLTSGVWSFVATALVSTNGLESDNSNEVEATMRPSKPTVLRTTAIVP